MSGTVSFFDQLVASSVRVEPAPTQELKPAGKVANATESNLPSDKISAGIFKNTPDPRENLAGLVSSPEEAAAKKESLGAESKKDDIHAEDLNDDQDHDEGDKIERTVFVGSVPVGAVKSKKIQKALNALFAKHGKVASMRFRSISFTTKQSHIVNLQEGNFNPDCDTANAYVVMDSREAAVAAAKELNGTIFESNRLRVDLCFNEDAEGALRERNKRSVFVGNLAFNVKENVLWEVFEKAGDVESVRIVRDKTTGLGKGFGYVLFRERPSAALAVELHGAKLNGRELRVFPCRAENNKQDQKSTNGSKSKVPPPSAKAAAPRTSAYAVAAARRVALATTKKKRAAAVAAAAAAERGRETVSRHTKAERQVEANRRRAHAVKKRQVTRDKQRKIHKFERKSGAAK